MEQTTETRCFAREIRRGIMREIGTLGVGHIGGCLSVADVLAVLYNEKMRIDPENPHMEGRDRLVVSKGHAGPAVYAALALKGFFPMEWLDTLNLPETRLPSHCDMNRTPGIDMTAGSLGQGISCAVGIAKASKIRKDGAFIYCIIGDGESQEGQVWEASMAAAQLKLDNLIIFLDNNNMQIDGTVDEVNSLISPLKKWSAFGFAVSEVDGHDTAALCKVIDAAKAQKDGRPKMIVLHTIKGKGVGFVEDAGCGNHNMPVSRAQMEAAFQELDEEGCANV